MLPGPSFYVPIEAWHTMTIVGDPVPLLEVDHIFSLLPQEGRAYFSPRQTHAVGLCLSKRPGNLHAACARLAETFCIRSTFVLCSAFGRKHSVLSKGNAAARRTRCTKGK